MKSLLFTLIFGLSSLAFASPIAGTLQRGHKSTYIYLDGKKQKYILNSSISEASIALKKLSTGDYLIGNGVIDEENRVIELDALDYVGLKKLLGVWYNRKSIMNFKNYTDLTVYPIAGTFSSGGSAPSTEIRYSMAPYAGNQWAIFLSNSHATVFATIELGNGTAKMRLFDADTGNASDVILLTRWRD